MAHLNRVRKSPRECEGEKPIRQSGTVFRLKEGLGEQQQRALERSALTSLKLRVRPCLNLTQRRRATQSVA